MHMADALLSPAVGGIMWATSAGLIAYSAKKVSIDINERKAPLMGVMGAFVFAAQMINFTIPGTGSSGHLGGGMILSIILGPHAAFLTIASVLVVQAVLFADGGLLALGCNIFNLGFAPAFICYPLIYRKIAGPSASQGRVITASLAAAVVGLQLGAFGVVLETLLSGKSELPFGAFVLLMQPIHLAIGIAEGLATAAVVSFVRRTRPEVLDAAAQGSPIGKEPLKKLTITLAVLAVLAGAALSWFASTHPDGLEWSMLKISGKQELAAPPDGVHEKLQILQEKTAIMPDYAFKKDESSESDAEAEKPRWPTVDAATSTAGLVGGAVTLALVIAIGFAARALARPKTVKPPTQEPGIQKQ